jgi:hypothetical protein
VSDYLYIERRPTEGWKLWTQAHTPPKLGNQIQMAAKAGKENLLLELEEKLELLLEREKSATGLAIKVDEWRAAVSKFSGARLATQRAETTNPKTGDVLTVKLNPNDVEVLCDDRQWQPGILFSRGRASFSVRAWLPRHPVGAAACHLAHQLKAFIVDYEGGVYPLQPGSLASPQGVNHL